MYRGRQAKTYPLCDTVLTVISSLDALESNLCYGYPTSTDMARSLANDLSVAVVYAYTEDLANHLVSEATKLDNAPYMSKREQVMDLIMKYSAGTSEDNE
jgi:hypothetical protein